MRSVIRPKISGEIQFYLTEEEARALHAITLYGYDNFIDAFFKKLGRHYLETHLSGLKSLFNGIKNQVNKDLKILEQTRNYLDAELKKDLRYRK